MNKGEYSTVFNFFRSIRPLIEKFSPDEAYFVLKLGGRFICLEFSKVQNEDLSKLYRAYSKIIPIFGKIIVGDEKPYKYLSETIENFPDEPMA